MPIFAESKKNIFADVLNSVLEDTNITRTSPGSIMRSVVESMTSKLGETWTLYDANVENLFPHTASGRFLDWWGDVFGITRGSEKPASVTGREKVIYFERTDTSEVEIIPRGTVLSTLPDGLGVSYVTTAEAQMGIGVSKVFVSARSRKPGTKSNLGENSLKYHDHVNTDLTLVQQSSLNSGTGMESDENLRFRISKFIRSSETANYAAIKIAVLSVSEVANCVILNQSRGVGTFTVMLESVTPSVTTKQIANVQEALRYVVAQGVNFDVIGPKETGVSMQIAINLKEQLSEVGKNELKLLVQERIFDYIDNLAIAEPLVINELVQNIMNTSSLIKSLGVAGKPIDRITLYKESALSTTKIPENLFSLGGLPSDYMPASDEKLLVELTYTNTENPITVIVN